MTPRDKRITYLILVVATMVFSWPAGFLVLFGIADYNGDIPTKSVTL